jgi:hypothetical protein
LGALRVARCGALKVARCGALRCTAPERQFVFSSFSLVAESDAEVKGNLKQDPREEIRRIVE